MVDQPEITRDLKLDALRGSAAFCVVIHHFLLVFYPALFTTQAAHCHTAHYSESLFTYTPLSFAWNGNFAVSVFFVLSGYVLSLDFFRNHNYQSPSSGMLRRYPRLVIPVAGSVILSWIILKAGGYANIPVAQAYTHNDFWFSNLWNIQPDFLSALKEAFIESIFYGGTSEYNPVLWTINMEFFGSALVYALLALTGIKRNRIVIYILLAALLYKSYLLAFVIGVALCDYRYSRYFIQLPRIVSAGLVISALYCGSFHWLRFLPPAEWGVLEYVTKTWSQLVYIGGAALLVLVTINVPPAQPSPFLKAGGFPGKISFSMYLLHLPVIGSFSCRVLRKMADNGADYHVACLCTFLFTLVLLVTISFVYYRLIDRQAIGLSRRLYMALFRPKSTESTTSKKTSTTHFVKMP